MKARWLWPLAVALALGAVAAVDVGSKAQDQAAPPDAQPAAQPEGVQVQTRGPVHEAYAEPVNYKDQAPPLVTRQPPDPIQEVPPDQKPEGDNVQWIPGYWAWDADQSNFLWVSGFWRDVPPDRQWVPGHWAQAQDGWQWSPGFWTTTSQNQVEYLPPPPESVDAGPSTPAPDENSVYVPGCWLWRTERYAWRPGFWMAFRPNWLWQPAHYCWSPAGYVFVDGYWDHPLEQRGLLFAPVTVQSDVLTNNWTYTPSYVVQPDFLLSALFVQPRCHSYYFGDYFEPRYADRGFVPFLDYRVTRACNDPLFTYYAHSFPDARRWEHSLRDLYAARRDEPDLRPPHTLVQQEQVIQQITRNNSENVNISKNINISRIQNVSVVAPLNRVNNVHVTALSALAGEERPRTAHGFRLAPVSREERTADQRQASDLRQAAQHRHQVESGLASQEPRPGRPPERPRTATLNLPRPAAPASAHQPGDRRTAPPPPPNVPRHEERPGQPGTRPPERPMPPEPRTEPKRTERPNEPAPRPPATKPPERPVPPEREPRPPEPPRREERPPAPRPPERPMPPQREPKPPQPPRQERPPQPAPRPEPAPKQERPPAPRPPEPKPPERPPQPAPRPQPAPKQERPPAPAPRPPAPRPPEPRPPERPPQPAPPHEKPAPPPHEKPAPPPPKEKPHDK